MKQLNTYLQNTVCIWQYVDLSGKAMIQSLSSRWVYTALTLHRVGPCVVKAYSFQCLRGAGIHMSQVLSCFPFGSGALFHQVNVSVSCVALGNTSWAQEDLGHSANPVLWISYNVDRTFVVISKGHTSQCFSLTEMQCGFLRHTISGSVPPESHESLVFVSPRSWHDKYTFGLSAWLCEITGPHEHMGSILSSSCKDKCSVFCLQGKVKILSEILPHAGIKARLRGQLEINLCFLRWEVVQSCAVQS